MATPKDGYRNAAGDRIPGTTTVIGRFKDSGGLIQWAYKQGREHGDLSARGKDAPRHLYDVSGKAADIGTAAHSMVEAHINGDDPEAALSALMGEGEDFATKARSAFNAYLEWASMTRIELLSNYQEIQLVSEEYQFGGTPDAIGRINGKVVLIDWKTSNGVYQDYLIQLAAYKHLIENGVRMDTREPLGLTIEGFHLCRFAKEHADFGHHHYPNLDEAWEAFTHMRRLYDLDKGLKQRAA